MRSGALIYIPSFIRIGSDIQKLIGATQTHRQHGDSISLLSFFSKKESRLKNEIMRNITIEKHNVKL
jgi:hypothetical protein